MDDVQKRNIVTYPRFACLIRRVLDLMVEFIGLLVQLVTTVHKSLSDTLSSSDWILSTSDHTSILRYTPSRPLTVPSYNSSARTPRKTPSSFNKNACLLGRYLAMDVLLLLSAYASGCVY
jgi:hypothetical protein